MNEEPPLPEFTSLAELQENHSRLAQDVAKDVLAPANLKRIIEFVHQGVFTGRILDASADRAAAQSLVTFWTSRVAAAFRDHSHKKLWVQNEPTESEDIPEPEFPETLLADFSPDALQADVIDPADRWVRQQPAADQLLAKCILLRLLRLREKDDSVEVRSSATGVCDGIEPRDRAEQVLNELIKLGVVRPVGSDAGQEEVALRSPTLLERWPLLQKQWLEGRKQFRQKAIAWAKHRAANETNAQAIQSFWRRIEAGFNNGVKKFGAFLDFTWRSALERLNLRQHSEELLTQEEFEEAETYRDRIPDELKLTYQKRLSDKERNEKRHARWNVAVVIVLGTVFWAVVAGLGWWKADREATEAKTQEGLANDAAAEAKKQEGLARAAAAFAKAKEDHANVEARRAIAAVVEKDEAERVARTLLAIEKAGSSFATKPQRTVLLASEALRIAKEELALGKSDKYLEVEQAAEEMLRNALAHIGGMGFYADIGAVTHLAAHENTSETKSELRWLAAAGAKGVIALWDFKSPRKHVPKILPFGYAPPIQKLFITKNGKILVAVNDRNNVTCWDLEDAELRCWVIEGAFSGTSSTYLSPDGEWLEVNNGVSKVRLIRFVGGKLGAKFFDFDLDDAIPKDGESKRLLRFYSFSKDGKWFAIITTNGEALVWNLKHEPPTLELLPRKGESANAAAVNGEFLNDSKRLAMFLANGTARYWDLDPMDGRWRPEEVLLMKDADLVADRRGTHAILIPKVRAKPDGPKDPVNPAAVCFDAHELHVRPPKGKPLLHFDPRNRIASPDVDDTGRWLIARYYDPNGQSVRIWDLASEAKDGIPPMVLPNFPEGIVEAKSIHSYPWIATRGSDDTVRLLDLRTRSWRHLRGYEGNIRIVAQSQNGRFLVTGAEEGAIRVWNLNPLSLSMEPFVHQSFSFRSMVITPNGRWLAISLPDGSMLFKEIADGGVDTDTYRFSEARSRDGGVLVGQRELGGDPNTLHIATGKHKEPADLITSADGLWLLERAPDSDTAVVWDLRWAEPLRVGKILVRKEPIQRVLAANDGAWLVVQTERKVAQLCLAWEVAKLRKSKTALNAREIPGTMLDFGPSSKEFLVRSPLAIEQWDLFGSDKEKRTICPLDDRTLSVTVAPDGKYLILSKFVDDKSASETRLFDLSLNDKGPRPILKDFNVYDSIFFSADGMYMCSIYPLPRYWDLKFAAGPDGGDVSPRYFSLNKGKKTAFFLARSNDRRWLVTSENQEGYLWDLSNESLSDLKKPRELGKIDYAAFTADSMWLVTTANGTLTVYKARRAETERTQLTNTGFRGKIVSAAVMADGSKLALVGMDSKIYVWDLNKKDEKTHPRANLLPPGSILEPRNQTAFPFPFPEQMYFAKDGSRLYSLAQFPNALRVSRLRLEDLKTKAAEAVGRNQSKAEWALLPLGNYQDTFPDLPVPAAKQAESVDWAPFRGKSPKPQIVFEKNYDLDKSTVKVDDGAKPGKLFPLKMSAGNSYTIDMRGSNPDFDSFLILKDSKGDKVAWDDDSGGNLNARIQFVPKAGGDYTIVATTFDGGIGPFHLAVAETKLFASTEAIPLKDAVRAELTEEDLDTGSGPGKVYKIQLPASTTFQVTLTSPTFSGHLRLEDKDRKQFAIANAFGERTRIVFNTRAESELYYITVIGTRGKAGPFELSVTHQ